MSMEQKHSIDADQEQQPLDPPIDKKIMWVEDDVFLSDIISKKCETNSCSLFHAIDYDGTFELLKDLEPDVIILDILLPGKNGFEILQELRKMDKTKDLPIIILSNFGQKEEIEKGLKLGADKYLIKATLTLDEILGEVNKVMHEKTGKKSESE